MAATTATGAAADPPTTVDAVVAAEPTVTAVPTEAAIDELLIFFDIINTS